MRRGEVIRRIEQIRYPTDFRIGADVIADVVPDLEYQAMYPSFRCVNPETWEREDSVVLFTEDLLVLCEARSQGFEVADVGGRLRRRQDFRQTTVRVVPRRLIRGISLCRDEGKVLPGAESPQVTRLRIDLESCCLGTEVELPFAHDVGSHRDHHDIQTVYSLLESFIADLFVSIPTGRAGES